MLKHAEFINILRYIAWLLLSNLIELNLYDIRSAANLTNDIAYCQVQPNLTRLGKCKQSLWAAANLTHLINNSLKCSQLNTLMKSRLRKMKMKIMPALDNERLFYVGRIFSSALQAKQAVLSLFLLLSLSRCPSQWPSLACHLTSFAVQLLCKVQLNCLFIYICTYVHATVAALIYITNYPFPVK